MFNNHTMASQQAGVQTAEQWREFIAGGRSKTERKCDNNTTVRAIGINGGVAIKLHDTDIIRVHPNGQFTLNTGGWQTVTTKERINKYTPARISQRAGIWYMLDGSLFYDGMLINNDGTPRAPRKPATYEKKLKSIKKQAREYAKAYVKALQNGAVGYPSSGDCWGCYFKLGHSNDPNKHPFGVEHLQEHMKQKYFVPSLLVNAGRDAGYKDMQIGLMGMGGQRVFIEPENVLYKYIVKQLQKGL